MGPERMLSRLLHPGLGSASSRKGSKHFVIGLEGVSPNRGFSLLLLWCDASKYFESPLKHL